MTPVNDNTLLDLRNLEVTFKTRDAVIYAVNDVSFSLSRGDTLGIVGESGSGKSVSMLSLMGLVPCPPGKIENGQALFLGRDLLKISNSEKRKILGKEMSMVFQDPMTSLNPVLTIGLQITELLIEHLGMNSSDANDRAVEVLEFVGLAHARSYLKSYPHEFSGGMRQRVMIAMALSCNPFLLIADEPTTALDVTVQAQIIRLIKHLQDSFGMTLIWISHDLAVISELTKRVLVMYGGQVVEDSPTSELFVKPMHPYTMGLLNSLPQFSTHEKGILSSIPGEPPILHEKPTYCTFAPRCPYVVERCCVERPKLELVSENHRVACWRVESA